MKCLNLPRNSCLTPLLLLIGVRWDRRSICSNVLLGIAWKLKICTESSCLHPCKTPDAFLERFWNPSSSRGFTKLPGSLCSPFEAPKCQIWIFHAIPNKMLFSNLTLIPSSKRVEIDKSVCCAILNFLCIFLAKMFLVNWLPHPREGWEGLQTWVFHADLNFHVISKIFLVNWPSLHFHIHLHVG